MSVMDFDRRAEVNIDTAFLHWGVRKENHHGC